MRNIKDSLQGLIKNDANFRERYENIRKEIISHPKVEAFFIEHREELSKDMVERSLMKLYEFIGQSTNCGECESLEACKNILKGYEPHLVIKDKMIDIQYNKCAKKELYDERRKLQGLIQSLYIPKDVLQATMKDFALDDGGRIQALNLAEQFLAEYEEGKQQKGLYLYGKFGVGKTYILGAIANELARRRVATMIVYVPEFFRELKASIQNNTMEGKLEAVKKAPVLMLDDVGAESMSSWVRDEILSPILQYRMQEKLPTFFTSNFNFEELTHHFTYSQRGEAEQMKANRIMERIKYLTVPVEVEGKNRRS